MERYGLSHHPSCSWRLSPYKLRQSVMHTWRIVENMGLVCGVSVALLPWTEMPARERVAEDSFLLPKIQADSDLVLRGVSSKQGSAQSGTWPMLCCPAPSASQRLPHILAPSPGLRVSKHAFCLSPPPISWSLPCCPSLFFSLPDAWKARGGQNQKFLVPEWCLLILSPAPTIRHPTILLQLLLACSPWDRA